MGRCEIIINFGTYILKKPKFSAVHQVTLSSHEMDTKICIWSPFHKFWSPSRNILFANVAMVKAFCKWHRYIIKQGMNTYYQGQLNRPNLVMFGGQKLSRTKTLLFPCIVTLSRLWEVHQVVAKSDMLAAGL